jgi:hypothetical protein
MASRTVTHAVVTYKDAAGLWQSALRGDEIEVHADDVDRLEAAGAFDALPVTEEHESLEVPVVDSRPSRNASLEAWQDYARTQGADDEYLDGKSRNDLRDEFSK